MKPRNPYVRACATRRTRFEDKREALRLKALREDAKEVGMGDTFVKKGDLEQQILSAVIDAECASRWRDPVVSVRLNGASIVGVNIEQMYEYVDVNAQLFEALARVLQTKKLDMDHGDAIGGCRTCDFGSQYVVEVQVSGSSLWVTE